MFYLMEEEVTGPDGSQKGSPGFRCCHLRRYKSTSFRYFGSVKGLFVLISIEELQNLYDIPNQGFFCCDPWIKGLCVQVLVISFGPLRGTSFAKIKY